MSVTMWVVFITFMFMCVGFAVQIERMKKPIESEIVCDHDPRV